MIRNGWMIATNSDDNITFDHEIAIAVQNIRQTTFQFAENIGGLGL